MTGGEDASRGAQTSAPSGGRAQVRRDRVDGVAVVRGHRRGGSRRAVADPAARRGVLRHTVARPGAQPDHLAAPHRRRRRRLASEAAGRTRQAHRDASTAVRIRRRCAGRVVGCGAGDRPRPAGSAGRADQHSPRKPDPVRRRGRRAGGILQRRRHRMVGRGIPRRWCSGQRPCRTAVARMGTGTGHHGWDRRYQATGPASQPAARCRCRTCRPRLQTGAGARCDLSR